MATNKDILDMFENISKPGFAVLILLTIVILVSEFFLLDQNFALKRKVSEYRHLEHLLTQLQAQIERSTYETELEGNYLPTFSIANLNTGRKNGSREFPSRFVVMIYFSASDYLSVITSQLNTWNRFFKSIDNKTCRVIAFVDDKLSLKLKTFPNSAEYSFPVFEITNLKAILSDHGIRSTPAILFADAERGRIIYACFPSLTDLSSDGFVKKVKMLLDVCNDALE